MQDIPPENNSNRGDRYNLVEHYGTVVHKSVEISDRIVRSEDNNEDQVAYLQSEKQINLER